MKVPLLVLLWLTLATPTFADAEADYVLHCRGCHGPEGAGVPPDVPDLRGHVARYLSLAGGREYLMRVPGVSQSELSDGRTATLLTWLVRMFDPLHVPEDFVHFSEAEVARHRRPPLTHVAEARAALLAAMQP